MKKIDLGINFLIEKHIKPLSEDVLSQIFVEDNYYQKDYLESVFYDSKTMQDLADAAKRFCGVCSKKDGFTKIEELNPHSEMQMERLDIFRNSYNLAVSNFVTRGMGLTIFQRYLNALLLLSLFYNCQDYFQESILIRLLDFCAKEKIWF